MIEIKDICKSFGEQNVLEDISAVFETGKTSLIMGASGSGKTVLIKCIVGLLEPDCGEVLYHGRSFLEMKRKERKAIRREIGMLFQGSALFDSMNVEQNVMLPLNMFTDWSKEQKLERVNFCLNRVNLENINNKYPDEISGGMAKRVGIARAIVMNPVYLFCDEPNSGLDPQTAGVIDALIHEITQEFNITTVVNTHDMNSVMEIGESVLFLHKGKKEWSGTRQDVLKSENKTLQSFIFASKFLQEARVAMLNTEAKKSDQSGYSEL